MIRRGFVSLLIVIWVSLISQLSYSQTKVFIPDANFRSFLNLTYPTFMDVSGDSLLVDSAATLTSAINCDNRNIADLTGIEYFVNIPALSCQDNQLIFLPDLSSITNLYHLNCSYNQLVALLVLSANTALQDLYCEFNRLTYLPDLSNNTALTILHCNNNILSSLPDLSANTALTDLICDNNQLTYLPDLSSNMALSSLVCSKNQLTYLPDLSNNTALTILRCMVNRLTSLPDLSANTALTILYCANNQLTHLPDLSSNTALSELQCTTNELTSLPDLSANTNLTLLRCGGNQLTQLPDLSANTALIHLACDDNQITSLPDLSAYNNLSVLDCRYNQITSLPDLSANTALTILQCSGNPLTSLPDLSSNIALTELRCTSNQLTRLPDLSANTNLTLLLCEWNQLTQLPDLSANTALTALNCRHNQFTSLPDVTSNESLIFFDFVYNKLDFSDAKALRITDTLENLETFTYTPQNPFGTADSLYLCEGDTRVLYIARQDSATAYQWFKDGDTIAGATDTLYILYDVTQADSGTYTCKSYGTALLSPPMIHGPGIDEFISEPWVIRLNAKARFSGLNTSYCLGDPPVILTGFPAGGVFSGPGINDSIFTPAVAGVGIHTITYTCTGINNCISSDSQEVTVEDCTGIIDHESIARFKIYPNPNNGIFNITLNDLLPTDEIGIRILTGQGTPVCMEAFKPVNGICNEQLDLSGYPAGIYYIQIISDEGIYNRKIVIE